MKVRALTRIVFIIAVATALVRAGDYKVTNLTLKLTHYPVKGTANAMSISNDPPEPTSKPLKPTSKDDGELVGKYNERTPQEFWDDLISTEKPKPHPEPEPPEDTPSET